MVLTLRDEYLTSRHGLYILTAEAAEIELSTILYDRNIRQLQMCGP